MKFVSPGLSTKPIALTFKAFQKAADMISAKYSGPAKNVVAKLFKYAEEETKISRNYPVLSLIC